MTGHSKELILYMFDNLKYFIAFCNEITLLYQDEIILLDKRLATDLEVKLRSYTFYIRSFSVYMCNLFRKASLSHAIANFLYSMYWIDICDDFIEHIKVHDYCFKCYTCGVKPPLLPGEFLTCGSCFHVYCTNCFPLDAGFYNIYTCPCYENFFGPSYYSAKHVLYPFGINLYFLTELMKIQTFAATKRLGISFARQEDLLKYAQKIYEKHILEHNYHEGITINYLTY